MTRQLQERILNRIAEVDNDISELKRVRIEIAKSGTASASLSSGGGSKSYTRLDLASINTLITQLVNELNALRSRISGGSSPIRRIMFVR